MSLLRCVFGLIESKFIHSIHFNEVGLGLYCSLWEKCFFLGRMGFRFFFLQYREWPLGKWAPPPILAVWYLVLIIPPWEEAVALLHVLLFLGGRAHKSHKSIQASCSPASILRTTSRLAGLLGFFTSFTACLICVPAKQSCLKLASMRVYQWAGFHDSLLQPDCLLADQDVF